MKPIFAQTIHLWLVIVTLGLSTNFVPAADFKGAAEVLRLAAESRSEPKPKLSDPHAAFRDKLKRFAAASTNSSAADAAKQWLTLIDQYESELSKGTPGMGFRRGAASPLEFDEVMDVLPPPAAWEDLQKFVVARPAAQRKGTEKRELGLQLIAYTLTRNSSGRAAALKALETLARKGGGPENSYAFNPAFEALNRAVLATMDDPDAILRMLENQLSVSAESSMPVQVPNLSVLVGPAKAEAFFRKALKAASPLEVEPGTPTHKLVTKIALEMIDEMPKAQWGLVNSLDSVDLYEAMNRKFRQTNKESNESAPGTGFLHVPKTRGAEGEDQAKLYYFLGLIARDRVKDAITAAREFDRNNGVYFPPEVIKQMERAGLTQQLNNFFATLLKDSPEAPFWEEYVRIAAHAGHAEDALTLVRSTATRPELSATRRSELKTLLPAALLANDEVDAGIAELRRSVTNQEPASGRTGYGSYSFRESGQPALQIAKIGHLLGRKDWIDEGIVLAMSKVETNSDAEANYWRIPDLELADFLSELGRGAEAEEVLLKALQKYVQNGQSNRQRMSRFSSPSAAASVLSELIKVYYSAGRFADIVRLLDDAPYWGAKDLLELRNNGAFESFSGSAGGHAIQTPLAFYVAAALARIDRKAEAAKMLDYLIEQQPGLDRLYELLIELEPTNSVNRLDQLFARDAFEERPLIWKAHWLRTHGQFEAAEEAARRAISIDPSDGEEGPGDRMRAYAELAEIRAARGDAKEAEFFRGAVAAIRQSEMADRLHEAGLLKRAVKMYEESLTHFADAYCIQSRLAVQLSDLGLHQLAEEHYRRAYELMPESFGRVESHCFGCERAFEGERAQGIAEKVFTKLAETTPDKPQVHYLLGYLREEQERPKEALDHYRQAVKLDPDYLNAWHKMDEVSKKTVIAANERDSIIFNLIRLDPNRRHVAYSFEYVSDLASLWSRVAATKTISTAAPTSLYPLNASKKQMEETAGAAGQPDDEIYERIYYRRDDQHAISPARAVGQNDFVRAGASLISGAGMEIE